ncbi:Regulator of G protein signaling domain-containing protein [Phytophthora infestans]|uniref:Regulator of G protein signaling domain-containing protein n=1 Tax=Phytophthora infestans TaxID=4787 RepID=A0A8S9UJ30_PHYIN|nr:Regulator of G protein signaling domain-containing protein [Phytophthora infestans]
MGAAASMDDPDASVVFRETKEEYERRVAAGDSKEEIFSSLRDIVATRLGGTHPLLHTSQSLESFLVQDLAISESGDLEKRSSSLLDAATLAAVTTSSESKESTIETSIALAKTIPDDDDVQLNPFHDDHEVETHIDEQGILRATVEKGFGRAVGSSRAALDLVQNLAPVFTTDVLTDPTTLKMILKYAEANKVPSGADMLRFWVEIDELQHLPSHSYTHRRLRKIYDKFLSPEAPSPVCVTAQMLQDIEKALEGDNISAGIYAGAQQICYIALEKSVYPRFRDSKLFRKMQDFCAPVVPNAGASSNIGSSNGPTLLAAASATGTVAANITDNMEDAEDYSLLGILAHPAKLRFLKTFCMEALALENLLFYLEVEDCKRLPNLSFVVNKTRKIYDRYCSPSSKNFIVGLGDKDALKEIHDVVENKGALVPKLFYEVQIGVFNRISDDIWPGFCRSQEYLDHSKEVQPDAKHLARRGNRFEESEAVQKKLEGLAELQLIDAAMHYPVEKLIPISVPDSIQGAARRKSIQKLEEEQTLTPEQELKLLLGDPFAKKYLKLFMTRRGVDSLLAFCEEVEDFKLLPGIEFLQHSAKKIYRKYIIPSARLQVDMSKTMREEIFTRLANPSVDMFKKIANRVRHGMLQDSLPRFVKSNYYKDLRRDSKATPADPHLATVDQAAKAGKLELCHLDVFLTYPGCMQAFRKFLDFQHCSENLMLWEEIEHYRRLPSYQIVLRSAKKIYDKYLNPNNPRSQIPFAPALLQRVETQLEVASRTTFDEVENECYDHMRNVVMPDFLDSRIFMALVGTWATVHEDYPAEMLRGELEMAFLRHRFHLVQEARGMSRDSTVSNFDKGRNGATPTLGTTNSGRVTNG